MPIRKYNGKCYLKVNDKQMIDYAVDKSKTEGDIEVITFTKDMPYILELTFYKYEFEKIKNKLKDIQLLKLMKLIRTIIYRMGLSEPSLTTTKTIFIAITLQSIMRKSMLY